MFGRITGEEIMGFSASAILVVGVRIEQRTEKIEKTKYDQDTGAPYKITVDNVRSMIVDTDICADDFPNWNDSTSDDFDFHDTTYRSDGGDSVWGVAVKRTASSSGKYRDEDWIEPIEVAYIGEAKIKVKEALEGLGVTADPQPFLVLSMSY